MSDPTALPPIPADIASSTAPLIIGVLFNWLLFGVLSVQTYIYYLNFAEDKLWIKLMVYGAYILEVAQTALTGADVYFWFASGYGNLNHLGNVNLSPVDIPVLCGLIALLVQCFFAYRIYVLRKQFWWISVLVILTSLLQTGAGIGSAVRGFKLQEYALFHENVFFPQADELWVIGDIVCDVMIAITMLWLYFQSRQDGMKYGGKILRKVVVLIVETNTLTASMAVLSLIFYIVLPGSPLFVTSMLIMGKLYSNTLLIIFNNRIVLRKDTSSTLDTAGTGPAQFRRTDDFNSNVSTFHVVADSFATRSVGVDSYEIGALKEDNKRKDLTYGV